MQAPCMIKPVQLQFFSSAIARVGRDQKVDDQRSVVGQRYQRPLGRQQFCIIYIYIYIYICICICICICVYVCMYVWGFSDVSGLLT